MSSTPGWYQDPEGPPGQARYWDGQRWAPRAGQAAPGGPGWLGPVALAVAVALVVGLAWWGIPALLQPSPTPSPSPTISDTEPGDDLQPSPSPSGPAEVGELNCAAARSSNFPKGPELRVAGIVVPFPDADWGFRFDSSQWTWVNDLHGWGTLVEPRKEGWAAGLVVGRLEAANGFGEPEAAATAVRECLTTYGVWNDADQPMETVSSSAATVDGMPGWELRLRQPEQGTFGATDLRVLVLDAGQEGNLAMVIGFNPSGDRATASQVEQAFDGIHRQ